MSLLRIFSAAALFVAAGSASAQVIVAGYGPAVVAPVPVVAYRPVVPAVAYVPAVAVAPAPVVVAGPPAVAVAQPVAVTRAAVAAPVVRTRYRPFLGGTVTRVRYRYAPATVITPLY